MGIDLGEVEPLDATLAYTDFLLANTFTGTLGDLVASMTPCMRLYRFLGARLAEDDRDRGEYDEWVRVYSGAEYGELVGKIESLMDRYEDGSKSERDRYLRAMKLEYGFFDEA